MTRIRIITCYNKRLYDDYAWTTVAKSQSMWHGVDIQRWSEDGAPHSTHDLNKEPGYVDFLAHWRKLLGPHGRPASYLYDAGRFAHKVFALTSEEAMEDTDWLVFLGADVDTLKPIDADWLLRGPLARGDIVHLGRRDIRSSETDFLAIRVGMDRYAWGESFLSALRHIYTSGDLYNYAEWIDGYIVGRLAAVMEGEGANVVNLSVGLPGLDVFERTVLGERLRHWKGPQGKATFKERLRDAKS